jgi:hypothetical protein
MIGLPAAPALLDAIARLNLGVNVRFPADPTIGWHGNDGHLRVDSGFYRLLANGGNRRYPVNRRAFGQGPNSSHL